MFTTQVLASTIGKVSLYTDLMNDLLILEVIYLHSCIDIEANE